MTQLNNFEEDLDNVLDERFLLISEREYVKSIMRSNSFIKASNFYENLSSNMFEALIDNEYIKGLGPNNSFTYIINAASGQYIITDMYASAKATTYRLSNSIYMKVIDFSNGDTRIYITNSKSVLIFHLEFDEQNNTFVINNKDVIPSPIIKTLSVNEEKETLTLANTQYILHVLANNKGANMIE